MKFEFTDELKEKFERDGFVVLENLFDAETCDRLKGECARLVEGIDEEEEGGLVSFSTDNNQQLKEDYFLTSGDKIRFFWEPGAVEEGSGKLNRAKMIALNKIGHALHALNPVFGAATFDERIKQIFRKLGFVRPVVPQSMYIFKAPNIGGEVSRHVDASFLMSEPSKLVGVWIALEDTSIQNGCLHFVPGSHRDTDVTFKLVRDEEEGGRVVLRQQGSLRHHDMDRYAPVEIGKGSAILIHGKVHHYSEKNTSSRSRHVYTYHVVESHMTEWSALNWLQPTENLPFTPIYDDSGKPE